ncbi:hypothetical protein F53441_8703 [Fusarium austroafricanum]|uniref:Uncharacterized protein n=1 Tax=Fusarium austroafricanum TaxID=2364996 RepID=A0A8H4KDH9_9HYPO|nr:hypothetical protein F53441_8703 [Fusarium austroafricanum]
MSDTKDMSPSMRIGYLLGQVGHPLDIQAIIKGYQCYFEATSALCSMGSGTTFANSPLPQREPQPSSAQHFDINFVDNQPANPEHDEPLSGFLESFLLADHATRPQVRSTSSESHIHAVKVQDQGVATCSPSTTNGEPQDDMSIDWLLNASWKDLEPYQEVDSRSQNFKSDHVTMTSSAEGQSLEECLPSTPIDCPTHAKDNESCGKPEHEDPITSPDSFANSTSHAGGLTQFYEGNSSGQPISGEEAILFPTPSTNSTTPQSLPLAYKNSKTPDAPSESRKAPVTLIDLTLDDETVGAMAPTASQTSKATTTAVQPVIELSVSSGSLPSAVPSFLLIGTEGIRFVQFVDPDLQLISIAPLFLKLCDKSFLPQYLYIRPFKLTGLVADMIFTNSCPTDLRKDKKSTPDSNARIFLDNGGFEAWLAYFLASTGEARFNGKEAQRALLGHLENLSVEERAGIARRVADSIHLSAVRPIKSMEQLVSKDTARNNEDPPRIYEDDARPISPPDSTLPDSTLHTSNFTDNSPLTARSHTYAGSCLPEEPPQVVTGASIQDLSSVFPEYISGAIRRDRSATGGHMTAAITMNFPPRSMGEVDCAMTLVVEPNKVERLAMLLFGAHLESDGISREVVLEGGTRAIPHPQFLLQGSPCDAVSELLHFPLVTSTVERPTPRETPSCMAPEFVDSNPLIALSFVQCDDAVRPDHRLSSSFNPPWGPT